MTTPGKKRVNHERYWAFFFFIGFFLALSISLFIRKIDREIRREGISSHTYGAAQHTIANLIDAETGLRGLLIDGNRDFLQPYYAGTSRLSFHLTRLINFTRGDPEESIHAKKIEELSKKVLLEFSEQLSVFDLEGLDKARDRFRKYPTKAIMDEIRLHVETIQNEEERRLGDNLAQLATSINTTVYLLNISLVTIALMGFAMVLGWVAVPFSEHVDSKNSAPP